MALSRAIAIIALGAAASACVVFPVPRVIAPEVSGVLLNDGKPVANAEIELVAALAPSDASSEIPPGSSHAVARTDANGKFKVGPLTGVKTVHTYGDELLGFYIVIRAGNKELIGFTYSEIASVPSKLSGVCDLAKARSVGNQVTYCDHDRLEKLKMVTDDS
ncbi:DUF4198 domain-containing protein [Stappia sp. BW2]|uniref:DUF4198 domain-containing protein n=1 Tax=Stappia sp. BW2 TaxID=2592622 RepID=UPI0011DEED6B|nr:DUF4198 domain-containing protein [Stappia sp. BW2]TYC79917.1 DUF4198 domain-containing protein [Stappia sp. BW2]